jgi:hypothetical protein
MTAQFAFNPNLTTTAKGSFSTASTGLIVGTAYPDPAARYALSGGILLPTDIYPMWGGVAISENIPQPSVTNPQDALGGLIARTNDLAYLTGFSVFDQNYAGINSPQSPVPQTLSGGLVNFYRLRSGARVALAIDPALVSLEGGLITQQVSWNFEKSQVSAYQAAYAGGAITAGSYVSGTGVYTFATTAGGTLVPGSSFTVKNADNPTYNGPYTVVTASGTSVTATSSKPPPTGSATSGTLSAGGGALPVSILDIEIGNSYVPVYNTTTGALTWNTAGSACVALL